MVEGTDADSTADKIQGSCPIAAASLRKLIKGRPNPLQAYFDTVSTRKVIDGTATSASSYYLKRDGNRSVRVGDLAKYLREQFMNYAIPRRRMEAAHVHFVKSNGDASKFSQLEAEAKGLFTKSATTGECGEILLYVLAESVLGLPQVLCKMPLKTNSKVHYHGIDGVHASADDEGTLAIYWGESKLHASIGKAVGECFDSIGPFLVDDGGTQVRDARDIQLLRDHADLGDPKLEAAFRRYLDPDDPMFLKLTVRGMCLIGFDHDSYPDPYQVGKAGELTAEMSDAIEDWRKKIGTRVVSKNLASIQMEALCIPFPSVEDFRSAFLKELG